MPRLPEVTIIIVNWNGARFLPKCLDSLRALDYPRERFHVLLVDNHSTDESLVLLRKQYPEVEIIENPENFGFAKANNIGIRHARTDLVALLNNDTWVNRAWLRELVGSIKVQAHIGGSCSKVLFALHEGVINNAGTIFVDGSFWPVRERGYNEQDHGQYDTAEVFDGFCGVSVVLHRDLLQDIGLFDEDFFLYFEDTDLAWRAKRKGWRFAYNPRSVVHHIHSGTAVEHSPTFTFYVTRNWMNTMFKNAPMRLFLLVFFSIMGKNVWQCIVEFTRGIRSRYGIRNSVSRMVVITRAFASFLRHAPAMYRKRLVIRQS